MISLGSQLAFSFHALLLVMPKAPDGKICLSHLNILLIISYRIQAHNYYSKHISFAKCLTPFHLDYYFSWCHRSIIEIDVFLHLPLSRKG